MSAGRVTGSAVNGAEVGDSRLVTRVRLRNYKSIATCDVRPAPLSFLVGPNGSGKSNFLDALVGIEEPEIALHPAAAGVLIDSLTEASQSAQVIVSSHSADLLDNDTISDKSILAALSDHAKTRIGPLDDAGRSSLRDHLFTAGEWRFDISDMIECRILTEAEEDRR